MEQWRDIDGYEGYYQVSDLGRIRSVDRVVERSDGRFCTCKGRVLSFFQGTTCNYFSVQLSRDNIPRKFLVHRLVAKAFIGINDPNLEVNHKDGNRKNNRFENLEVVTHQQNIDHSVITGLKHDYGEQSVRAKITNKQAEEMRRLHKSGMKQKQIAEIFNVSKQVVNSVVNYKTYFK